MRRGIPFKFNRMGLEDELSNTLVIRIWGSYETFQDPSAIQNTILKLKHLKRLVYVSKYSIDSTLKSTGDKDSIDWGTPYKKDFHSTTT